MSDSSTAPFVEHVRELRRRVLWSLTFVCLGAGVGYLLYEKLLFILQQPYGRELYYTTPTGALSFLIKVCVTFGFIVGLPVVTYQILAFIAPVAKIQTRRTIAGYLFASVSLAAAGVFFAYFISLPAALHFLVNFGNPESVQALITANEYFNFVLAYLAGFALLFQIPLLVLAINRITPLKPLKLLGGIKYVVLASFIVAAVLTPTPDPFNQAIMAGPMVLLYLISVGLVAAFGSHKPLRYAAPEPLVARIPEHLQSRPKTAAPMAAASPAVKSPAYSGVLPSRLVRDMIVPPGQESESISPGKSSRQDAAKGVAKIRPVYISDFRFPSKIG